jgi:predicted RNA-binding Zn ribbon-like protein
VTFSFHRGSLALDFVGTVGKRGSATSEERLTHGGALGDWLVEAGLLASARPRAEDLGRARGLREAIYAAAAALMAGEKPEPRTIRVINRAAWALKLAAPRLTASGGEVWVSSAPIQTALARVAADAIARLANDVDRMTFCELAGCGALLLSHSRSDRRRWCSMALCGNRAKAAAHRARQKGRDGS